MSQKNVDVVRRLLGHYNETGEPAWELIDPEVEWVVDPGAFLAGIYRGHQGVRAFFGLIAEAFDRFQLEVDSFVDSGDAVVALGHARVHGELSGVTTGQPLATVWRVRDGRVVAFRSYLHADEALEAFGVRKS